MTPIITAFEDAPDGGQGFARDFRLRWALEEVGQPYDVRFVTFATMKLPAHRALNPFAQLPTYEAGDLALFESGAILLHIADTHPGLLPAETNARARAITWLFAALNTVEPPVFDREMVLMLDTDAPWYYARLASVETLIRRRLADLATHLGPADWLDGAFSAGDLLMVTVLRMLGGSALLAEYPTIAAYIARAESRPAFKRAFAAQRAIFEALP